MQRARRARPHGVHPRSRWRGCPLAVGLAITALYSALSLVRWMRMGAGVDLAIFAQAAQRYAHLQLPFSGIKAVDGFNLLGDHFSPVVALFAPAYGLLPHAWILLVVQSALVGLAATLLTGAAAERLGRRAGVCLGLILALAPGVQSMALFDVHEVAFALPLLVVSYLRVVDQRYLAAVAWAAPLVLVKEDAVFLLCGLALVLFARRQRRLAALLSASALACFALIVLVVIPSLSYYGSWTYWSSSAASQGPSGPLGIALGSLHDATLSGAAPSLGLLLIIPTLGLALRSPLLLGVIPVLASRWTSPNPSYWGPGFHYDAAVAVVVVLAAYDTLVSLRDRDESAALSSRYAVAALAATLVVSIPGPAVHLVRAAVRGCDGCRSIARVLTHIPDGALVAADDRTASYLVDRTRVIGLHSHFRDSTGRVIEPEYVAFDRARADAWTERWIDEHFHSDEAEELGEAVRIGQPDGQSYDVVVFRVRPGAHL